MTKKRPPPKPVEDDFTTLSAFKVKRRTIAALDAWLAEQNEGRRGPTLSRNDLIRGLMDWAADERPAWEGKSKAEGARR